MKSIILAPLMCIVLLASELILVGLIDLSFAVVKFCAFFKRVKTAAQHLM
ncbi:hypothetical protein [uncultured Succinivibrio sp.]|nr:hypothetical protein [uncultured Succinivibrio sp.]